MVGNVKFLKPQGWGFIAAGFGQDFYFCLKHVIGNPADLIPWAEVDFWLDDDPRGGLEAVEVQVRRE